MADALPPIQETTVSLMRVGVRVGVTLKWLWKREAGFGLDVKSGANCGFARPHAHWTRNPGVGANAPISQRGLSLN